MAQAQEGLAILDSSVQVDFPTRLDFSLSARSDVNITDIRLNYTVDQISYAQVISEAYIEFAPGLDIEESWSWDMRRTGGLPPGTGVDYFAAWQRTEGTDPNTYQSIWAR